MSAAAQTGFTSQDAWSIVTTDTGGSYTPAYLGNGIIGIRSDQNGLRAGTVHLNGLYDRSQIKENVRLVDDYNPLNIDIQLSDGSRVAFGKNIQNWRQTLNLKEGILETAYDWDNRLHLQTQLTALRCMPVAAILIFEITAKEDMAFTVQNEMQIPDRSGSAAIYKPALAYNLFKVSAQSTSKIPVLSTRFPTESGMDCIAGANTFYFDTGIPGFSYAKAADSLSQTLSFQVVLKKGETYRFALLSTFQHSGFTTDPYADAIRMCSHDYHLGYRYKIAEHKARWARLWESDIIIEGDVEAQQVARMAMYCLYASIETGFGLSIPPCGIANEWGGHIFWDAELWMYPPLLLLHAGFAGSVMDFRIHTLDRAKKQAAQFGYEGAMYPWESDAQGNECTSIYYKLDMTEHHITADIAIAAWNYYCITQDKDWLRRKGFPLLKAIAGFWVSRATSDHAGNYHINNVVGSDEYFEDVNDDAFTNAAAKNALHNAVKAALLLKEPWDARWQTVADKLVILVDKAGYTLQNDRYDGRIIKQADVNLLAFPLEAVTNPSRIAKDLDYYKSKINPKGPTMSYSVLATIYARLGDTAKAYQLFMQAFQPNRKPPFGILAERSTNNVTPFCTGYGGLLQTILFGFAGLHIGDAGLYQGKVNLPAGWKKLTIKMSGKKEIICVPVHRK